MNTQWVPIASTTAAKNGRWTVKLAAPPSYGYVILRAVSIGLTSQTMQIRIADLPKVTVAGPGARILGADISHFQHSSLPIDFKQMASGGIAFLYMKASDAVSSEDRISRTTAMADTIAARSAGIYVGYYHVARLPSSNTASVVKASANAQVKQALARLAELGGYDDYTLPYALDIELAPKSLTKSSITLWTRTWLEGMYKATNRRSVIYSYRSYLASKFSNDATTNSYLRQSPLWIAHPGNPANPAIVPGHFDIGTGCYKTAWTLSDCTASWSFWQYTASGDRELYGIPWSPSKGSACPATAKYCSPYVGQSRKHLDLNVFSGSISDLMTMSLGTWQQAPIPKPKPNPSPNPSPTQ